MACRIKRKTFEGLKEHCGSPSFTLTLMTLMMMFILDFGTQKPAGLHLIRG